MWKQQKDTLLKNTTANVSVKQRMMILHKVKIHLKIRFGSIRNKDGNSSAPTIPRRSDLVQLETRIGNSSAPAIPQLRNGKHP